MKNTQKDLADIRKTTDLTMTQFNNVEKAVKKAYEEGKKSVKKP